MLGTAILTVAAESVLSALAEKSTDSLAKKLRGDPAKNTLKQALGKAIDRYASTDWRLELASPLLRPDGPLAEQAVAREIAKVVSAENEPDLTLIAERWKAAFDAPPQWRDFREESRLLVQNLRTELRSSEVFRPVFDSRSLDAIAETSASSADSLSKIELRLNTLADLLASGFGSLLGTFARSVSGIRSQIRDQTHYIERKTQGFIGRDLLFAAFDRFTNTNEQGYFIVRGKAGVGKTAVAAQIVKVHGFVHHFNIRADGFSRPEIFLRNICAQLISAYGLLEHSALPPDAGDNAWYLLSLLREISDRYPNKRIVVVVDALDEATMPEAGANILYIPSLLPRGVYFFLTARDGPLQLRVQDPLDVYDLDQGSEGNLADVRRFVEQSSSQPGIQRYIEKHKIDREQFIQHLVQKSEGNFMYLVYVLPEIERGAYQNLELSSLPAGLQNYYESHWEQLRHQDERIWLSYRLPIIKALAVTVEPSPIEKIAEYAGILERTYVVDILQRWAQFVEDQEITNRDGQTKTCYRWYHASFHDFIRRKLKDDLDEGIELRGTHRKIAEQILGRLSNGDEQS